VVVGVGNLAVDVEGVDGKRNNINNVLHVKEVRQAVVFDLNDFKDQEREVCLAKSNDADHFTPEVKRQLVILEVREVASVGNERTEVNDERNEKLREDRIIVALPHEIDIDTHLRTSKNLIVIRLRQNLGESSIVISDEDPVKVEDLSFDLLQVGVVGAVRHRFHLFVVLERGVIIFLSAAQNGSHVVFLLFLFFMGRFFLAYKRLHVRIGEIGTGSGTDHLFRVGVFPLKSAKTGILIRDQEAVFEEVENGLRRRVDERLENVKKLLRNTYFLLITKKAEHQFKSDRTLFIQGDMNRSGFLAWFIEHRITVKENKW
jgi:hypothetical protein